MSKHWKSLVTYLHRGVAWLRLGDGSVAIFRLIGLIVVGNPLSWFQLSHSLGYLAMVAFAILSPMTVLDILYCTGLKHQWTRYSPPPRILTNTEIALLALGLSLDNQDPMKIEQAFHDRVIQTVKQHGKGSSEYQTILSHYRELMTIQKIK